MPKKDTAAAVIGMLSTAGAQTRATPDATQPGEKTAAAPTVTVTQEAQGPISPLPTPPPAAAATAEAPRTLRLRPATAHRLRQAWLEAKRDDVLLTAQDFASGLVEEALAKRRRRPAGQN